MRSPTLHDLARRWWAGELGGAGRVLDALCAPAEWLYRGGAEARNRAYDGRVLHSGHAGVPVISVGNLAVGGAGKTPVAAWLLQELLRRGRRPALLHGGYADDEPALHRLWAPQVTVIAERDRLRGASRAVAAGADVLVLDDGFQHRRIARDLDLVLVAAETWERSPRLLPRGGWREGHAALGRAHLVAVTRRTADRAHAGAVARELGALAPGRPVLELRLAPAGWVDGDGAAAPPPGAAFAVAAIAEPAAFLANAAEAGATVQGRRLWPDHHAYTAADAATVVRDAAGLPIVTTAKDWVKLSKLLPRDAVRVLRQEVIIESGEAALEQALERVLRG